MYLSVILIGGSSLSGLLVDQKQLNGKAGLVCAGNW